MKRLFIIFSLALSSFFCIQGQTADEWLQKVEEEFSQLERASYDFELTIEIPEQSDIIQKGNLKKDGKKVYATIGQRWIKSDGTTQWVYDPELNEVQIYKAEGNNALPISPDALTSLYKNGDFKYDITGTSTINGTPAVFIEFKPLDKTSEYTKMRFALNQNDGSPIYFKVFSRDATRYTLTITSINDKPKFDASTFTFDKDSYPNVRVEDLRL